MRVYDMTQFRAVQELHETLHLHEFVKLRCGVRLCACGAEHSDDYDFLPPQLRDEINDPDVREEIVDRFGPELYVYLKNQHDMLAKAFSERYNGHRKLRIAQANDGSYHIKRKPPSER